MMSTCQEMGARNRTMCCVECHGELACINAKSDKELASMDLSTRLQNLTKNECKSLLIEWMNSDGAQKVFMIPTSQLVTTSCMTSQIQGFSKLFHHL